MYLLNEDIVCQLGCLEGVVAGGLLVKVDLHLVESCRRLLVKPDLRLEINKSDFLNEINGAKSARFKRIFLT